MWRAAEEVSNSSSAPSTPMQGLQSTIWRQREQRPRPRVPFQGWCYLRWDLQYYLREKWACQSLVDRMLLNFKASSKIVTSEVGVNVGILELCRYKSSTAVRSTPVTIKAVEERVVCWQGMDEELLLKNDGDDRSTWCLHASTWYAANKNVSKIQLTCILHAKELYCYLLQEDF